MIKKNYDVISNCHLKIPIKSSELPNKRVCSIKISKKIYFNYAYGLIFGKAKKRLSF